MRAALTAIVVVTPALAAGGQELSPSISQTFGQNQLVEQRIDGSIQGDDLASLTNRAGLAAPDLTQKGDNLVNLLGTDIDIGSVSQIFNGSQTVENAIVSGAIDALGAISQSGSNAAGIAMGRTIDFADQRMESDASQLVHNLARLNGRFGSLSQAGVNLANLAVADYAIGTAHQTLDPGATQTVRNELYLTAEAVVGQFIEQSGENLGNIMITDRIESVVREFSGDQIINNTVYLADDEDVPIINQSGSNIANLIVANDIGAIRQISNGTQVVSNNVIGPDGKPIAGPTITQGAESLMGPTTDVVNLAMVGPSSSSEGGEMSIDQESNFDQSTNGTNSPSQAGNVVTIVR